MSDTQTYADNYAILEKINNELQSGQNDPKLVDELADKVMQATKSYQACKERLEAAEKALKLNTENNLD